MTAHDPADSHDAAIVEWLWRQRLSLAPIVTRKDRELDDLVIDMTDDLTERDPASSIHPEQEDSDTWPC